MAVRQVRKQRGGTKNQVSIVEVHLGSKLSVRATWGGHTHHAIYCHFTCDDEAGPFQWTRAQSPFFPDGGPDILHFQHGPHDGAPFLLVALHKGAAAMVKAATPATASALGCPSR
jgi:hypothetical protein